MQGAGQASITGSSVENSGGGLSVFFFNDAATTEIYPLSLHDALPIFGVTLAFNSIGWKPQNILFNAVDAIISEPAISSAFRGEGPSGASASISGSTVSASEGVSVIASAGATLLVGAGNEVTTSSSGPS